MSEHQVDTVLSTITCCRKWLQLWAEVLDNFNPLYQNDIPDPSSMNIGKLGRGSDLTSDTCNGERKNRCIIVEQVHEAAEALLKDDSNDIHVLEVGCWNHLRKVWLRGMTKSLSNLLENTIKE